VYDLSDQAKQGVSEAAEYVRDLAEDQKNAGADRFKGYAGAISRAADSFEEEIPIVADFARKAAGEIEHLAEAVKERELSELVGVASDYARRQPVVFLGATALAGFALARFLMTSSQRRSQQAHPADWQSSHEGGHRPLSDGYGQS
jgi:predicted RNA-binding protein with PIN domain